MSILIRNINIVNEGQIFKGGVLIENQKIVKIFPFDVQGIYADKIIEGTNKYLLPGIIDDQVHFRDYELSYKGTIATESKAAVAGGVTSYMDMPNTKPQTTTIQLLEDKYLKASAESLSNYSFYMGTTNDNINEILNVPQNDVCGIKIFFGASTGNMLVNNTLVLEKIFSKSNCLIAVHCESEPIIQKNLASCKNKYGELIPISEHPNIRSAEACYESTSKTVKLAQKYGTRLHVLHLSTAQELNLFRNDISLSEKLITSEVCVHHLWFSDEDYTKYGTKIKWNPAIKTKEDREALWKGLLDNHIDLVATDHAPHTKEEKNNVYEKAPSGGPLIQHSLVAMLEQYHRQKISIERIVEKMCHAPAQLFRIKNRGYIREGYQADLVIVDLLSPWEVTQENILYKCGWSPFEGTQFQSKVCYTIVNGHIAYDNGIFDESIKGERLLFER